MREPHVEPHQVGQAERSHRVVVAQLHRAVDVGRRWRRPARPSASPRGPAPRPAGSTRSPGESFTTMGSLPSAATTASASDLAPSSLPVVHHDLHQLHQVDRVEEVHAQRRARAARTRARWRRPRGTRCWWRAGRLGRRTSTACAKTVALEVEVLGHRLDDEVGVPRRRQGHGVRSREARQRRVPRLRGVSLPRSTRAVEGLADALRAQRAGGVGHGVGEPGGASPPARATCAMPWPIVPAPMTATGARRCSRGDAAVATAVSSAIGDSCRRARPRPISASCRASRRIIHRPGDELHARRRAAP